MIKRILSCSLEKRFEQGISRVLSSATIYLDPLSPVGSCDSRERSEPLLNAPIPILHRVGFTARLRRRDAGELLPRLSILTRCRAVSFCCTFPGVASAGCYPALCPVVLGLSSPALAGAVAFLTQINLFNFQITLFKKPLCLLVRGIQNPSAVFAFNDAIRRRNLLEHDHRQRHVAPAALAVDNLRNRNHVVQLDLIKPL